MAESILDQALALIPGVGKKTAKAKPSKEQQLAAVRKSLAKLARDVQSLAAMIEVAKPAARTRKPAKAAAPAKKRGGRTAKGR